jgi:hypothetical protein
MLACLVKPQVKMRFWKTTTSNSSRRTLERLSHAARIN